MYIMHVHCKIIRDFTCFSACEEYRISEMRDCTPHISRFRSLRRTAVVMQIPGWWAEAVFFSLRWSVCDTMVERRLRSVGALWVRSSMKSFHRNVWKPSTAVVRNGEGGERLSHRTEHSWSIFFKKCFHTRSASSLFLVIAPAIEGMWPLASSVPSGWRDSGSATGAPPWEAIYTYNGIQFGKSLIIVMTINDTHNLRKLGALFHCVA